MKTTFRPGYMLNPAINSEAQPLIERLKPVYRKAFASEPWFEVSKCAQLYVGPVTCDGGFSPLPVGKLCKSCEMCPTEIAYTDQELDEKFLNLSTKKSALYVEEAAGSILMAAVAYQSEAPSIFKEKYIEVPEMQGWLQQQIGDSQLIWLDEVFSDRELRPTGNLNEFTTMIGGLTSVLGFESATICFRTISSAMVAAAYRFRGSTTVFERKVDVPDRRDFVMIKMKGEEL